MSRGFPSMTALLGMLAIAGYQNRDKIAEILGGIGKPGSAGQGGIGGFQGDTAESWVNTAPNKQCTAAQLEQALGPEVLDTLSKQTGLTRDELVSRLCRELPEAVDKYTPQGRIPTEAELSRA